MLLGATGTGKTATVAWAVERLQRPTLVMQPNKTLAAQFANELRQLLPNNAVEYFVSYYDYYQPEAYVPQTDTYIEKDSSINEEVERLRHSATNSLLTRRDVIVVSTVSCIYGLGTPQEYVDRMVRLRVGGEVDRDQLLRTAGGDPVHPQRPGVHPRHVPGPRRHPRDLPGLRGARGPRRDVRRRDRAADDAAPGHRRGGHRGPGALRLPGHPLRRRPGADGAGDQGHRGSSWRSRLAEFERQGKLLEAQRLRMRTTYDIEMMRQVGSCSGIENYSMHIDGRSRGSAPNCLLDYFPEDFLLVVDESHVAVPQIGGMYEGDMSRKRNLVDHGFRLPSAMDNRPLRWEEFLDRIGQTIYLSATPGHYELDKVGGARATSSSRSSGRPGWSTPRWSSRATKGQIDDLIHEIRLRAERNERVLVTTLTKKMSEDLTDYLLEAGIRTRYLHSEVDTLRRIELLRELRLGEYDVLVGINLLREGLDLPEVSLVAILDADKEGFLRSDKSLIQTIGRAARNVSGQVDHVRRQGHPVDGAGHRRDQPPPREAGRLQPGARPRPAAAAQEDRRHHRDARPRGREHRGAAARPGSRSTATRQEEGPGPGLRSTRRRRPDDLPGCPRADLAELVQQLTEQMHTAAAELQFEVAARLRDEISDLKKELRQMVEAGAR